MFVLQTSKSASARTAPEDDDSIDLMALDDLPVQTESTETSHYHLLSTFPGGGVRMAGPRGSLKGSKKNYQSVMCSVQ